jgi:hypothetical protein
VKALTAIADEEQLDEVIVVGPRPRQRRRHLRDRGKAPLPSGRTYAKRATVGSGRANHEPGRRRVLAGRRAVEAGLGEAAK